MAEQQLIDYIQKARQANQSDSQSKTLLLQNGWTEAEVSDAFALLVQPQAQLQPKMQPQMQSAVQPQPQAQMQPQSMAAQLKMQSQPQMQAQPMQQSQPQPQAQPAMQQRPQMQAQLAQNMPAQKKSHLVMKLVIVLIILIIVGIGGYFAILATGMLSSPAAKTVSVQTKNNITSTKTAVSAVAQPIFAKYTLESTKYKPALPTYQIALSELTNLNNFGKFLSSQEDYLVKNNFLIVKNTSKFYNNDVNSTNPNRNDDWTGLYQKIGGSSNVAERQPQNSVFVTTDFLTHVYNKLIDEDFSYIEESNLYLTLNNLSKSLLKSSSSSYATEKDIDQKASYDRLSAYFLVTSAILDNATADFKTFQQQNYISDTVSDTKAAVIASAESLAKTDNISDNAKNIAEQEIGLIFDANKVTPSPLMGKYQGPNMNEDYTQYAPRGHYAENVILRDYFRAMMFYGRMNFLLNSPELTRDAANINLILTADEKKQWESIYQPTAFFVGKSDDLTIYDYDSAENKTGYKTSVKSAGNITSLQNDLLSLPNPQIMSSAITGDLSGTSKQTLQNTTKGFRFMGQGFTPDAFIFSTLTQGTEAPDAKTGQSLPSLPTGLMVSTLMGSKESATLFNTWIGDNAPNSDKVLADRMSTLQDYFNKQTVQDWTQNIYWSWLYTIKSLFTDSIDKTGYPMFEKSPDWDTKSLQAFSGSWTELKHDTLLYAKQSYAVGTSAITIPPQNPTANPVPKGYVEPNPDFFDRLIALVNYSDDGLNQFGVLPANLEARNNKFLDMLKFYRTIAVSELQNQTISDSDFETLRLSAGDLDNILQSPDSPSELENNARSAVIADVATDMPENKILYEADGIPNYIYVAVKDANGTRLTKGLVYSYYEFTGPIQSRYTDQIWQGWNYSNVPQKLQMPWWNQALIK